MPTRYAALPLIALSVSHDVGSFSFMFERSVFDLSERTGQTDGQVGVRRNADS